MGYEECGPVSVSRRIDASASDIFNLLADPDRHPEFDGSGMLRPGSSNQIVTGLDDVFAMNMYFPAMGDYVMHNRVVAFAVDRCIAWEPSMRNADAAIAEQNRNGSRWRFDLVPDGPGATVVTETYDCSESPEEVRRSVDNGNAWIAGMTETLERLGQLCAEE